MHIAIEILVSGPILFDTASAEGWWKPTLGKRRPQGRLCNGSTNSPGGREGGGAGIRSLATWAVV